MERRDRSRSGLASSIPFAMDDREGSSSVLMTSDQDPDAVANLSGKGIHGVCCGCYRGMWWLHGTCFCQSKTNFECEGDLILLLFTMTENNGFFHQYSWFLSNDAEPYINFRALPIPVLWPVQHVELNDPVENRGA